MACEDGGTCQVLVFDVDVSSVDVTPAAKNSNKCPKKPTFEEIAVHLHPYKKPVKKCDDAACECIPIDDGNDKAWTAWAKYPIPAAKATLTVKRGDENCAYTLSGSYWVSSKLFNGLCLDKPEAEARITNPKRPPIRETTAAD